MAFLRRNKPKPEPEPAPTPAFAQVEGRQYSVALAYLARSGDAIRLAPGPDVLKSLPRIVEPLTEDGVEVVTPLPLELGSAAPAIERLPDLEQWILARRQASPVTRHALHVLEPTEAVDMTIDTLICGPPPRRDRHHRLPDLRRDQRRAGQPLRRPDRRAHRARRARLGRQGPAW